MFVSFNIQQFTEKSLLKQVNLGITNFQLEQLDYDRSKD